MFRHAFTHVSTVILLTLSSTLAHGASMARVVAAPDGRSLVIDKSGTRSTVVLAGVEPLGAPLASQQFLERTTVGSWVLLEINGDGTAYVYRSPDGALINTLLIREGYAVVGRASFDHRDEFVRVESDARNNWRGAWRESATRGSDEAIFLGELDPDKGYDRMQKGTSSRNAKKSVAPKAARTRKRK